MDSRQAVKVDSQTYHDIDMHTDINATRCFRSGPVMTVKELQVNDSNFPALYKDQITQGGAKRVVKKVKSGCTMTPGKVQESKVTTFLAPNPTRGGSARPHPVTAKKLLPITHSTSILMKAPEGVNNMGRNVWWEEVELWVTSKGREPYFLPPPPGSKECVLVLS